jgi:hypothetical protein
MPIEMSVRGHSPDNSEAIVPSLINRGANPQIRPANLPNLHSHVPRLR